VETLSEKKETRAKRQADVVQSLLTKLEAKLKEQDLEKASLSEYLKLVQLERQLEEENPPELKVHWVEPEDMKSESD
jgi:hypothetical protein